MVRFLGSLAMNFAVTLESFVCRAATRSNFLSESRHLLFEDRGTVQNSVNLGARNHHVSESRNRFDPAGVNLAICPYFLFSKLRREFFGA